MTGPRVAQPDIPQALTKNHLRLGILSDLHLAMPGISDTRWHNDVRRGVSRELLNLAMQRFRSNAIDALALLGDLSDTADVRDYEYLLDVLDQTGIQAWLIEGNHDLRRDTPKSPLSILAAPSDLPRNVTIAGPVEFIHLPLRIASAPLRRHDLPTSSYHMDVDTLTPTDGLLVWLSHFPILDLNALLDEAGLKHAGDLANRSAVAATLASTYEPVLALCGHLHVRAHTIESNILQLSIAALAEPPHEATIVDIDVIDRSGRRLEIHLQRTDHSVTSYNQNLPLPILDPARTEFLWDSNGWTDKVTLGQSAQA